MNTTNTQDLVLKALDRAFLMGQNYWADADSESWKAHKRSDVTREKFRAMRDEVCAALQAAAAQPKVVDPETSRAIDEAVKAGRIVFEPGWNAQPQGDAREVPTDTELLTEWDRVSHITAPTERRLACMRAVLSKWGQAASTQGFDAGDIASAAAQGFRDGVASTQASEPSAEHIPAKPATEADMQVYQGIADNYMATAPARAVEPLTEEGHAEFAKWYWKACDSSQPRDWMHAALAAQQVLATTNPCNHGIGIPATTPTQAAQGGEA